MFGKAAKKAVKIGKEVAIEAGQEVATEVAIDQVSNPCGWLGWMLGRCSNTGLAQLSADDLDAIADIASEIEGLLAQLSAEDVEAITAQIEAMTVDEVADAFEDQFTLSQLSAEDFVDNYTAAALAILALGSGVFAQVDGESVYDDWDDCLPGMLC